MKRTAAGLALAIIASLLTVAPAVAWHVETGDCTSRVTGRILEPYGDPFGRVVVRNDRGCKGWVKVPDERWVKDYRLVVVYDGEEVGSVERGGRLKLPVGVYIGRWVGPGGVFLAELETFTIHNRVTAIRAAWHSIGRKGPFRIVKKVPAGCRWKSGYRWLEGGSWTSLRDKTHGVRLDRKRVSPPGFYGPLRHDYQRGVTCT